MNGLCLIGLSLLYKRPRSPSGVVVGEISLSPHSTSTVCDLEQGGCFRLLYISETYSAANTSIMQPHKELSPLPSNNPGYSSRFSLTKGCIYWGLWGTSTPCAHCPNLQPQQCKQTPKKLWDRCKISQEITKTDSMCRKQDC